MISSWVRKLTSFIATFALVLLTSVIAGAYSQTGSELLTYGNMNTATSDGTFVLSAAGYGACNYSTNTNLVLVGSTFTSCEYNNGNCTSSTLNYTFAQYQACALFNYVLDGYMVSSGTDWPTVSGSPSFVTYTYPGGSGSDKMIENLGAIGVGTAGIVGQALSHGQTIGAGHAISVSAYLYNQQNSYISSTCPSTNTTVYGTAAPVIRIRLGSTTGTIEATSSSPGVNTWTQETASATTPSAGVYYVTLELVLTGVTVHNVTRPGGVCTPGADTTGYGNAYAGNITTSG